MAEKSYKEYLHQITTFIFDVDGVLTDGTVHITSSGEMLRSMNIKDGYALRVAIDKGFNVCIITGGRNEGVLLRLKGLGIDDIYIGAQNKIEQLEDYFAKKGVDPKTVLYMGDDLPDYPVMKGIGLPCCPQDAVQEIKAISKYISHKKGGQGAVRDVIEQVLKVQDKWIGDFNAKFD